MSGVRIDIDDRDVLAALQNLQRAAGDLTPALEDIGEYLLRSHDERWSREETPDGTPWAPLSPQYDAKKAKKRPNAGILVLDEHLRRLVSQVSGNELEVGTPWTYGATHQFGDPRRNIPPRPFLGIGAHDHVEILDIIARHIEMALKG